MTPLKPLLVVDKSFAHSNGRHLSQVVAEWDVVVPSAFYYEVLNTEEEASKRRAALIGFPDFQRLHIPGLLNEETKSGKPVEEVPRQDKSFNPSVLDLKWSPKPHEAAALAEHEVYVRKLVEWFKKTIHAGPIPPFSEAELRAIHGTDADFLCLCRLLQSVDRVREFARHANWPHAGKLDSRWLHFREFQSSLLQVFALRRRYPRPGDEIGEMRLIHDIHDIEYLTLGLFVSALATDDASDNVSKAAMGWRFRALLPEGTLITTQNRAVGREYSGLRRGPR